MLKPGGLLDEGHALIRMQARLLSHGLGVAEWGFLLQIQTTDPKKESFGGQDPVDWEYSWSCLNLRHSLSRLMATLN